MPFAAALSSHPFAATAVGEIVGEALDRLGGQPDLAMLFATAQHTGAMEDIVPTVRTLLRPRLLLGCTAESVLAGSLEVERAPALALWVAAGFDASPLRLPGHAAPPQEPPFDPAALLLFADPFTFSAPDLFAAVERRWPGLPIVGGNTSAARGPGGNRLVLDGALESDGAVGCFLGPNVRVSPVVSQGCKPIGSPFTVTKAEAHVIYEIAGRPAMERLRDLLPALSDEDRRLIKPSNLHLGRVVDERRVDHDRGDFLAMNVLGANRDSGAIAVGGDVEVGTTVQFQVRDAASASEDLRLALKKAGQAEAGLMFTCNGRGTRLFGEAHHDVVTVQERRGPIPLAGFFAAGEFGPVGGRNFVHGFTASLALFQTTSG